MAPVFRPVITASNKWCRGRTIEDNPGLAGHDRRSEPASDPPGKQAYWIRRITAEHRLVYKISDDEIRIAACRYHYGS